MQIEGQAGSLRGLRDDQLGAIAVSLVVSELRWTPDVAPAVMDRISRDTVTYPDQFDRRPRPSPAPFASLARSRSFGRTVGRLAVFAIIIMLVAALVLLAATANVSASALGGLDGVDRAQVSLSEAT